MPRLERFEQLAAGVTVPELSIEIDRLALVKYAGASGDFMPQHWDHPFMTGQGYPDVVVHGWLTFAHMCRAVTDWAPADVRIESYAVRYHRPMHPGLLKCGGTVEAAADGTASLALWATDADGIKVATGSVKLARAA
jgi:acyl dehydratase